MPLDPSIPLSFRQPESPVSLFGQMLQMQRAMQQERLMQQKVEREEAYRNAISKLPQNATEEQYLQAIRPFVGPDDLNKALQSSLDRRAALKQKEMDLLSAHQNRLLEIQQRAQEGRITRQEADQRAAELRRELQENMLAGRKELLGLAAALRPERQPPAPIQVKDDQGNVRLYDNSGNLVRDLGKVGTPSASVQKTAAEQEKTLRNINEAISELERATKDGGLIDKSTGSGAGALVDKAAGFVGVATPGAIAVGQLQPIYDVVLKMVPRFEGPQSDKDTQSYKEASGQLANPAIPNSQKKQAAKEILRLMKARRNQFVSKDTPAEALPPAGGGIKFLGFE